MAITRTTLHPTLHVAAATTPLRVATPRLRVPTLRHIAPLQAVEVSTVAAAVVVTRVVVEVAVTLAAVVVAAVDTLVAVTTNPFEFLQTVRMARS